MIEVSPRSMDSGSKALSQRFDDKRVDAELFCEVSEGFHWKTGWGVLPAPAPVGEPAAVRRASGPGGLGRRGGGLRNGRFQDVG